MDELEKSIDLLIEALVKERARSRELEIELREHAARWERGPEELDMLRRENARLKRNVSVAAEKVEELIKKL